MKRYEYWLYATVMIIAFAQLFNGDWKKAFDATAVTIVTLRLKVGIEQGR